MISKPETITEYAKSQEATIMATSKIAEARQEHSPNAIFMSVGIAIVLITVAVYIFISNKYKK